MHLSKGSGMEEKKARLTILINPLNKEAFEAICTPRQEASSEVVRQLMPDFLATHGVHYQPEGRKKRRTRR